MDASTAVELAGLIIYCLLYTIILYFWVFSFASDLRLMEDADGRQRVQGCCSFNERSLPKLFYFFVLVSLFGALSVTALCCGTVCVPPGTASIAAIETLCNSD